MKTILAFDQGTTGSKALLMNEKLEKIAEATVEFEQHYPKPGWVEHDLNQIWDSSLQALKKVLDGQNPKDIIAIGITNQRETLCFWEKGSAKPLTRAIVWQDRRTSDFCKALVEKGVEPKLQESTGLIIDPYFSGTKARWAFDNWEDIKSAHKNGKLSAGTIDSFLVARLSGGSAHVTEPSNASRTLCFHLTDHKWDLDLSEILGVPHDIWPEVRPSAGQFAKTKGMDLLPDGIPITGILGDQQSALLGQACVDEGTAKCTYGTGAFMLLNTGTTPARSRHRLLSTIAWQIGGKTTYALEGSAFLAGAAVQWVRDGLRIIKKAPDIEALAGSVESSDGVVFVPSLTGLGAPYWDPEATGMLTGITRGTQQGHIARAVLEGIAFQNADILFAMEKDLGKKMTSLNVDGGACANNLLMQFQADVLGVELRRPVFTETTSLGAVFAAGLGVGLWKDLSQIRTTWKEERTFKPELDSEQRNEALSRWKSAIKRVQAH